jgi:S1-C subfamily serine protease
LLRRSRRIDCGITWAVGLALFAPAVSAQEPSPLAAALTVEKAVVEAVARAERSVVAIARFRKGGESLTQGPLLLPQLVPGGALERSTDDLVPNEFGTGVVIDRQGLILTAYHLLGDPEKNTYKVWVARRPYTAISIVAAVEVKAGDPWTDLAVLKIEADGLEPIALGDGASLKKGQFVVALGNPYNIARDGEVSAGWGLVANLGRKARAISPTAERDLRTETLYHYGGLIQVDAKLNLGSSGGALINLKGEMVGLITTLGVTDGYEDSLGHAIPVDETFRRTVETLKNGRKPEFGVLGIAPEDLSDGQRQRGQLGARVTQVFRGTPAFAAHLQEGDVITEVNGVAIADRDGLMAALGRQPAGAEVRLTIQRAGAGTRPPRVVAATPRLSKKYIPSSRPAYAQVPDPRWRGLAVDYATALPSPLVRQTLEALPPEGGVAVTDVTRDSPGWKAGLRTGTLVSHVDGQRVTAPEQFFEVVRDKAGEVRLSIVADNRTTVTIAP